jgi:hypothetical protein
VTWPPGYEREGEGGSPRIPPFLAAPPPRQDFGVDTAAHPEGPEPGADAPRPFVLTAGRVLGHDSDIGLETQVTARLDETSPYQAPLSRLPRQVRAIVELCTEPTSVAEISARLRLHLDVTKILVGDLRAAGYLDVHAVDVDTPADADTILRVIDGLRAIS